MPDDQNTFDAVFDENRVGLDYECRWSRSALLIIGIHSLIWWYGVGENVTRPLYRVGGTARFLADTGLPALASCALVYVCIRPTRSFRLPREGTPWLLVGILVIGTLGVATAIIFGTDLWIWTANDEANLLLAVFIGPAFEELLYRGVVFELTERSVQGSPLRKAISAVVLSSVLFSLGHWHYHSFRLSTPAITQMAYALAEGFVFGSLRAMSASIWLGLALHVLNNALAQCGRL